jgi:hypothetical protein
MSKIQKGIPFIAFTSEVHPRFSLSNNFFKVNYQESYNNERIIAEKTFDSSMLEHYTSLTPDRDAKELDNIMVLLKSHYSIFKSLPNEKRILINTAFINNFDYYRNKNLNITFKILNHIFSLRSNLVRREWLIQNEEAVMEKLYTFMKDLLDENQLILGDRIVSIIWIFRDWDLVNRVFTSYSENFYSPDYPSSRELLNLLIFYIKYKCFAVNNYLNLISSKYLWLSFIPLMINSTRMRNCDFLFPHRANLKPFGSNYHSELAKSMDSVSRYGTQFTIKESATLLRFFAEYQEVDVQLIQRLLDHTYRSIMTKEAPHMRLHLIDIICSLPRLQMLGVKVPSYYYIFFYKAVIGSEYLIFIDMAKTCLEFLEVIDLPDHIKKIVLKIYFLNQRLQSSILSPFDNLHRIYLDDSIPVNYSPIEYTNVPPQNITGVQDLSTFNFELRALTPNVEETFPHFKMMEGKSGDEIIEKISTTIDILSSKITVRNRLTCMGYLIYLSRYNPELIRDYFESRNCNSCPFNSFIYSRQFLNHFYMLYALTSKQVLNIWIMFSKNSDKLYGLIDTVDFLLSLKIIKVTDHMDYHYLREIFSSLLQDISKVNQQHFEAIFTFTCWTGFFESGIHHPEVSAFYNTFLENLNSSLANQQHYIQYIRYLINWLQSQNAFSDKNSQKYFDHVMFTDEEIQMRKNNAAAITRAFYRENVNMAMNLGKFFAFNFMSPEGLNLTIDEADESLKKRIRKHSRRMNMEHDEEVD